MRLLAPASLPWFIRHELRVSWRWMASMNGGKGRSMFIGFGFLVAGALFLAFMIGMLVRSKGWRAPPIGEMPAILVVTIDGVLLFFISLMLAQSVATATMIFHDRGDLDLLLSSPVKPWRILATRMAVIAFNSMLFFQFMTLPLIITAAFIAGYWQLLAIPLLICFISLAVAAIGVAVAMGLFRILGPRRTRTVAQLIGVFTAFGILFFTRSLRNSGSGGFRPMEPWLEESGFEPAARWLAGAATAEPLPLLSLFAGSGLSFALVVSLLGRRFAANASIAAGEAQRTQKQARTTRAAFKSHGIRRIMIGKELKLLWRDPTLISQVLLQVVYLPVVMYLALTGGQRTDSVLSNWAFAICAGAMAYVAGQLAAGLGWLTISAEESPELLSVAPVTSDEVARAKVAAVVLPVAVLLGVLSLGLGVLSPWAGAVAFVGSVGGAIVIAYVELWMQRPGKRSAFRMRRRGTGSVWVALLEAFICMLLGAATTLAAAGTFFAFIPAVFLVAVVGIVASVNRDKWLTDVA